jgi:hypothetical protein
MGWKERLCERPLSRAFDEETRRVIDAEFQRRRHQIPVPVRFTWGHGQRALTIASQWVVLLVDFAEGRMIVDAKLSLAGKLLATAKNRQTAVRIINEIADDLRL